MELNTYQDTAHKTAIYPGKGGILGIIYCALKLNGEAGEVAEDIGKAIRDDQQSVKPWRREKILLELGDVLWYVAAEAKELGYTLQEVADANLTKIERRAQNGTIKGSGSER